MRSIKGLLLSAINLVCAFASLALLLGLQRPYPWLQWYGQVLGGVAILMISLTAADQGKKEENVDRLPLPMIIIAGLAALVLGWLIWQPLLWMPGIVRFILGFVLMVIAIVALDWGRVSRAKEPPQSST